jgi:hypothetical protein
MARHHTDQLLFVKLSKLPDHARYERESVSYLLFLTTLTIAAAVLVSGWFALDVQSAPLG